MEMIMGLASRSLACASTAALLALSFRAGAAPGTANFPAGAAIPAQLTLLKAQGAVGRSNPFYKGYRPTFFFAGGKSDIMCAVQLPGAQEKVDPGETVEVSLECIEPLSIKTDKPNFIFKEGGRMVGEGMLKLPSP